MMQSVERVAYSADMNDVGETGLAPLLPVTLHHKGRSLTASGLLDTGSDVNILPFSLGLELGARWEEQTISMGVGGSLARTEARALLVATTVAGFPPVLLAFAWTRAENSPFLLGQVNFFMEFDVCFFRSQQAFEGRPKTP